MADAFLDSSVLIGLVFRHAGESASCRAVLAPEAEFVCSRYVVFEVARGFLRSLIALYNYSFEFKRFADLHEAAYSGQQRFKPYRMSTWLGAFTDYFKALEAEDGITSEELKLEEFRAKLRGWIRRGWRQMESGFRTINDIGCREDLQPPAERGDRLIDQRLPLADCGKPQACRLQNFIKSRSIAVESVTAKLEALTGSKKDKETLLRIVCLKHLLSKPVGEPFDGEKCHRCGDALICLESPSACVIATKNQKHFEPLAEVLGKQLLVPKPIRRPG